MAKYKDEYILKDGVSPTLKKVIKNTGEMTKKLDKSTNKFVNLGNKGQDAIKKLDNQMQRLNSTLATVGKAFVAVFSIQKIAQLGSYVNKMGSQFEDTLVDLEVMLGSAAKAQKMFKDIQNMAIKTPFETSDLLQSTKLMLNFGIAEDKILDYTRMLGDIAGGDKNRFSSLALAFSQISANGKLQGQDKLQMINAGFNPLQELSKMTGKSMAQLDSEMSKGKISFDMVVKAMQKATSQGGKFYKLMEKRSQTFSGKMSTLMDSIGLWAGTTGMEINKKFIPFLDKIAPVIDSALKKTEPILLTFSDYVVKAFNYVGELFNKLKSSSEIKILKDAFKLLNDEIKTFIDENPELFEALKKAFEWLVTSGIPNLITSLAHVLRGVFKVFKGINDFFKGLADFIGKVIGTILSIPNIVKTVITNMSTNIIQGFLPLLAKIKEVKGALKEVSNPAKNFGENLRNYIVKNDNRSNVTNNNQQSFDYRSYQTNNYNYNGGFYGSPAYITAIP